MRKKLLRLSLAFLVSVMPALPMLAQIPEGYYSSLKGKKGAELKTAIWKIIKNAKVLEYGSGDQSTWWGFYVTDVTDDGYCIDRYSPRNSWQKYGRRGSSISGMNIEHSFAQSWWGKTNCNLKKDLFNIMPCESKINSSKGNRGMGIVTKVTNTNGATKVGSGANGLSLWEPADEWKGDFARGYMYIVTAYEDYANKWQSEGSNSLYNNTYPTLKEWAYKLYIQWAKADKPNAVEVKRNNDVYKIQGNRNPYVDFPNLMEYVWGDSTNIAFNPETTVKSSSYVNGEGGGGGSVDPDPNPGATETNVYQATFTTNDGGCKESIISNDSPYSSIWTRTSQYGWKGTAYKGSKYEAEATLSLPKVDLTEYDDAKLTISQTVNFAYGNALKYLKIEVRTVDPEDGMVETSPLSDFKVIESASWTFSDFTFDLSRFCGTKATISFVYKSDKDICCTWEIKKATIMGKKTSSGIKINTFDQDDSIDLSKPYDVYSIDGRKLNPSQVKTGGIVIIRQKGKVMKMRYTNI